MPPANIPKTEMSNQSKKAQSWFDWIVYYIFFGWLYTLIVQPKEFVVKATDKTEPLLSQYNVSDSQNNMGPSIARKNSAVSVPLLADTLAKPTHAPNSIQPSNEKTR